MTGCASSDARVSEKILTLGFRALAAARQAVER